MFLTGSKVGLGTPWRRIRDLFGPPLGLESCWGFAVSHASSTPCSRGPEVQANRGRSCHSLAVHCAVNFFFIWVPLIGIKHGAHRKIEQQTSPDSLRLIFPLMLRDRRPSTPNKKLTFKPYIQTLLPRPRQRVQNGETPRCASPDLRTVEKH